LKEAVEDITLQSNLEYQWKLSLNEYIIASAKRCAKNWNT
jgi:hypothetical protein